MAKTREPKQTTAFHSKVTSKIETAIENLCSRVKRTISVPNVSYREMMNLIAPSDHIEFLLKAREIAAIGKYEANISDQIPVLLHMGREVAVQFTVSGQYNSPAMPYKSLWLNHFPQNVDLARTLVGCADQYASIACDWGLVRTVFQYLNQVCKTPQAMYYIWPAIGGILSMTEDLQVFRDDIVPTSIPRVPSLPLEVRALCRPTAATVAMALMLPRLEDTEQETLAVKIDFFVDSKLQLVTKFPIPEWNKMEVWTHPIN